MQGARARRADHPSRVPADTRSDIGSLQPMGLRALSAIFLRTAVGQSWSTESHISLRSIDACPAHWHIHIEERLEVRYRTLQDVLVVSVFKCQCKTNVDQHVRSEDESH